MDVSLKTVSSLNITESRNSKLTSMTVDGTPLYFFYDGSGKPLCFVYNGDKYYYATNLQGDVVGIVNAAGNTRVKYTYDAWGNILSITGSYADTIGKLNPLRYRGYVYDQPTGLYYLQSRYYDPSLGRFINADAFSSTGQGLLGNNMFAYCLNNPVNNMDSAGFWAISFSIGLDFTFFFFGASVSIGIAFDDNANVAIQWSYSIPNYLSDDQSYNVGLIDAGVGASLQITDDDTVYDLEGPGSYAGFTAGDGPYGGVDMVYSGVEAANAIGESADTLPNGIQVSFGWGLGVDTHFRQTQTQTLWVLN